MADIDYRPRSATEILDASFHLLRDNYMAFVVLSAVAYFPLAAFTVLFTRYAGIREDMVAPAFGSNVIILMIVQVTLFQVMNGVVSILASRAYLQEPLDPGSTWKVAMPRLPAIVFTGLILIVSCFVGFFFLIFPAFYLYTRYGFGSLIAALEGTGVKQSFARSSFLSKGQKLRIFGVTLLALLLYFVLSIGLGIIAASLPSLLMRTVFGYIATALVWPALPMVFTVLYYDLRIRAEGYDVDLMARNLDSVAGVPGEPVI